MNFKKLVQDYESISLKTLMDFVAIHSVYDESSVNEEMPYGKGVANALSFVYNLATKDGFRVRHVDNRVVEIIIGNPNEPDIGIFAHADVVPATGEWVTPPFAPSIREGKLYARGTSDDKGPAVAAYYAAKALFDHDLVKDFSIRLVIGGDEERGSSCMRHYFKTAKAPAYGFTPDAEFPLIYGEKAITNFIAKRQVDLSPILTIKGGEAANSVIDKVKVTLPYDEALITYLKNVGVEFSFDKDGDLLNLVIFGRSAHGSLPELGLNAGVLLFRHLGDFYNLDHLKHLADKFSDPSGKSMDAYLHTTLLGASTYNIGLLNYVNGELSFVCNFRYPEKVDLEAHLAKLSQTLDMAITVRSVSKHLLFDPESDFIKTLMAAYRDETGDLASKPLAIGGGTYAKECPNTVAFGSAFKGRSGDIHSPNEHILVTDFYAQMAIYARAIYYLGKKLCA